MQHIARQVPFCLFQQSVADLAERILKILIKSHPSTWMNSWLLDNYITGYRPKYSPMRNNAILKSCMKVQFALRVKKMLLPSAVIFFFDQNVCENGSCFPSGNQCIWSCRTQKQQQQQRILEGINK